MSMFSGMAIQMPTISVPSRVSTSLEIIKILLNKEAGSSMFDQKSPQELSKQEKAVYNASLELIRNFINGEISGENSSYIREIDGKDKGIVVKV